jgi:putative transposase
MNTQLCLYQNLVWVVDNFDPNTKKLILRYLGGSQIATVDAADVNFIDAQQIADKLHEHVDRRDHLRKVDTDIVMQKRIGAAHARYIIITRQMNGYIDAKEAAKACNISLSRYYQIKRMYNTAIGARSLLDRRAWHNSGSKNQMIKVSRDKST